MENKEVGMDYMIGAKRRLREASLAFEEDRPGTVRRSQEALELSPLNIQGRAMSEML